jgi:hypothetical protein
MSTLIFGTSYVGDQHSRYVFGLWRELVLRLNPGTDVLVVDSASPYLPSTEGCELIQLGNNIGHLSRGGRDGWGRAFCAGIQYALDRDYEWVVHVETDLLFARPVADTLRKMTDSSVDAACPMAYPHPFAETALMFLRVPMLAYDRFVQRYDWENSPVTPLPEARCEEILGDALFYLPLKGHRNDLNQVTAKNMPRLDWLTHCTDPALYREFLRVNNG